MDIALPKVQIPKEDQDPHSKRLLKVCDLWDQEFTPEQIKRARRAYYGAVSYVDDCIGKLLDVVKACGLDDNTIVVFSGDHGDMLGERGLWYKMSYFESSVRVPLLVRPSGRGEFLPHRVTQNVSTLDMLPTLCDLVGTKPLAGLPMDGISLLPHLQGRSEEGHDTVLAEYTGEGTVGPLMMIRRGPWKFVTCPADGQQLFNLAEDPDEVVDLVKVLAKKKAQNGGGTSESHERIQSVLAAFRTEADSIWDYAAITEEVLSSQRRRRLVWGALKRGKFTSWDYDPVDDGREKYVDSILLATEAPRLLTLSFPFLAGTSDPTWTSMTWSVWQDTRPLTPMGERLPQSLPTRLDHTDSDLVVTTASCVPFFSCPYSVGTSSRILIIACCNLRWWEEGGLNFEATHYCFYYSFAA